MTLYSGSLGGPGETSAAADFYAGLPVIASDATALPEVVGTDGETGLMVPPGDPDALAHMLLRALGDADLRARIGAAGRKRVLDNFTWRQTAIGTVENYRALLDARAAEASGSGTGAGTDVVA